VRATGLFPQFPKKHNRNTGRIVYGRLRNDAFREKADGKNDSSQLFCQKLFCKSARIAAALFLGHSSSLTTLLALQTPFSFQDASSQNGIGARSLGACRKIFTPLWRLLRSTILIYTRIGGEQSAAAFAYYALFSLVPLMALLLTLGSHLLPEHRVEMIQQFVPMGDAQQKVLWGLVQALENTRGSVSLASIAILVWASLRFFQSLVLSINHAWGTRHLPWWQMPVKNFAMIVAMSGTLIVGTVVPALLQGFVRILHALDAWIIVFFPTLNVGRLLAVVDLSRYIGGTAVLFYSFTVLYMLAPRHRISFAQVWLPSLAVSVLMQIGQACFVNIVPKLINYNAIYGTMGSMMFLLLWVYIAGVIIISGGCFCAALSHLRGHSEPHPDLINYPRQKREASQDHSTKHPTP
jgi:membrane protein